MGRLLSFDYTLKTHIRHRICHSRLKVIVSPIITKFLTLNTYRAHTVITWTQTLMPYKDLQTNAAKFTNLHSELQENLEIP